MSRIILVVSRITFVLSLVLTGFCLRALRTTLLFPVYPDEIAERILLSRFGYDFPLKSDLMPMCKSFLYTWPKIWYFPAFVEWLMHGHLFNLSTLRLAGVLTGWIVCLLLAFRACQSSLGSFETRRNRLVCLVVITACIFSLMGIGVIPFYLSTVRPEQSILLFLVLQLILFSVHTDTMPARTVIIIVFFVCCSLMLYMHPKALFLAPVFTAIALRLFLPVKNQTVVIILFLLLYVMVLANCHAWINSFLECRESDSVNKIFAGFNIDFQNLTSNPRAFFLEAKENILNYMTIIHEIQFQKRPELTYLPGIYPNQYLASFNTLITLNYIILLICLPLCAIGSYIYDLAKKRVLTLNLLSLLLFSCWFVNFMVNKSRHWYDAGYLWSLLVVTLAVYVSDKLVFFSRHVFAWLLVCYLLVIGIISQNFLILHYEHFLMGGFTGPSVSLTDYHAPEINSQLAELSDLCHINKVHSENLIVDDLTYSYFQESRYPLAFTYLFYGYDMAFLEKLPYRFNIDGLIVRSFNLPVVLRHKYAIELNGLACVPKQNIKPLFTELLAGIDKFDLFAARINRIPDNFPRLPAEKVEGVQ